MAKQIPARNAPRAVKSVRAVRGAVGSPVRCRSSNATHGADARAGVPAIARASEPSPLIVDGELVLHGTVGADVFGTLPSFDARQVIDALSQLGPRRDITVRINSPGGLVFEGLSIFNSLKRHRGNVTVRIEGVAASAASVIAMAGDTIEIGQGGFVMIHDAWAGTVGTKPDHAKTQETLAQIDAELVKIYQERTGLPRATIAKMMSEETWLNADDAVKLGFADKAVRGARPTALNFDWDKVFKNAPAALTGARPADKVRSLSDFRKFLQEHGFSVAAAKALAAGGWPKFKPCDRRESDLAPLVASLRSKTAHLRAIYRRTVQ
jgi:ATP-dependent protease ClpP protease subunit